jgi:hypothetical protein
MAETWRHETLSSLGLFRPPPGKSGEKLMLSWFGNLSVNRRKSPSPSTELARLGNQPTSMVSRFRI